MSEKVLHEWKSEGGRDFRMLTDGSIRLGNEKGPMLLSGWEACFARELARLAAENERLRAELDGVRQAARSDYERGLECVEMKCSYCGERIAWPKNETNPHCIPRCSNALEEKPSDR